VSRFGPSVDGSLTTLGVVAAGVIALSVFALQSGSGTAAPAANGSFVDTRPGATSSAAPGQKSTTVNKPGTTTPGKNGKPGTTTNVPGTVNGSTNDSCNSSNNGGNTDRGVSATQIKLGATVVKTGIGATFLGPVSTALQTVTDDVKAAGGICGRTFKLQLNDDAWDPTRGFQFIQNLVNGDKVFALAVNPSSEGLRIASENHFLTKTKTPVVGSDGMLNSQYNDPWIWPVAASTASTMHIMSVDACQRYRAKNFGIVFDSRYRFGVEGAFAYNAAVKRCTGHDIPGYSNPPNGCPTGTRFCAISAGQTSYDTENHAFNDACFGNGVTSKSDTCDFVALLLEPNEAINFIRPGFKQKIHFGLAQTLFSREFATRCGSNCDGWNVWTGYNPPIEEFASLPAVKKYVATVRRGDPNIDYLNQFLEGGYAGMQVLVEAIKRCGANLTRDRLRESLDSLSLDIGLTTPLTWSPGHHYANTAMQAFSIEFKAGFNGFRSVTTWVRDPYVGQDQG
jgi:branched-chain amino acid transport system substrate-binding protein